jgi:hypothetical protein
MWRSWVLIYSRTLTIQTLSGTLLSLNCQPEEFFVHGTDIQGGGGFERILSKQLQIHVESNYNRILAVVR